MQDEAPMIYRHRLPTRLWHWVSAVATFCLLMSGLMIFNAHPRLYWGKAGANFDEPALKIGSDGARGYLQIGDWEVTTTGVLGLSRSPDGQLKRLAFPHWATIPSSYNLADGRRWHILFAWVLTLAGVAYLAVSLWNGHVRHDLLPRREELRPRHLWREIVDHAGLRFPRGEAAARYNSLQKLSYVAVIFGLLPLAILTGWTMSPGLNAAWPWLLDLFGGRQSARTIHFIAATLITLFIIVHLAMVLLAGPWNELRSMITGRFRLPKDRA